MVFSPSALGHTINYTNGNFAGTSTHNELAPMVWDGAAVKDSYNSRQFSWIQKAKFIEIGEQIAGTYNIHWTRFDFGTTAFLDKNVGQLSHTWGTFGCVGMISADYDGTYTKLDASVSTFTVSVGWAYYDIGCGTNPTPPAIVFGIQSKMVNVEDNVFWHQTYYMQPDLGNRFCVYPYIRDYNGAIGWVGIEKNSMSPTPEGSELNVMMLKNLGVSPNPTAIADSPDGGGSWPNFEQSDLMGVYNIHTDVPWQHDRHLEELLHQATFTESPAMSSDTACMDLAIMFTGNLEVFYNKPFFQTSLIIYWRLQNF